MVWRPRLTTARGTSELVRLSEHLVGDRTQTWHMLVADD